LQDVVGNAAFKASLPESVAVLLSTVEALVLEEVEVQIHVVTLFTTHWRLRDHVFNELHKAMSSTDGHKLRFWMDWQAVRVKKHWKNNENMTFWFENINLPGGLRFCFFVGEHKFARWAKNLCWVFLGARYKFAIWLLCPKRLYKLFSKTSSPSMENGSLPRGPEAVAEEWRSNARLQYAVHSAWVWGPGLPMGGVQLTHVTRVQDKSALLTGLLVTELLRWLQEKKVISKKPSRDEGWPEPVNTLEFWTDGAPTYRSSGWLAFTGLYWPEEFKTHSEVT
jgi:hypothetical protein